MTTTAPILEVQDLTIALPSGGDRSTAVRKVSFSVGAGEIVCLVGESGSGKSVIAQSVMGLLPKSLPVPVLIVQHMPPMFTQLLADRLNAIGGPVRCVEAKEGDVMKPGCAYLAPGGFHLTVARGAAGEFVCRLTETPPENSCRPAADVLFRSASKVYGAALLAVVMTGMGRDGMAGTAEIVSRGGRSLVQSGPTCTV